MSFESSYDPVHEFQHHVDKWADTTGARLLRVLCPLYAESVHRPEPVGTGVLIKVDDFIFLVTAAHVIEDLGRGPRYFGAAEKLISLPAFSMKTPLPASGTRDDDPIDLGYWILDPETAANLSSADSLRLSDLDGVAPEQVSDKASYFLNGYPETRQPRKLRADEFEARPFSFITEEMLAEEYTRAGRSREQHLLIAFQKDDVFFRGTKKTGPDLQGVSGGAIWRLSGTGVLNATKPLLSAFAVSWRQGEPKCVVGTRASIWIKHAADSFPQPFQREAARRARSRTV